MPNGDTKKLNFTLKVWDNTSKSYRPVYIAPDATKELPFQAVISLTVMFKEMLLQPQHYKPLGKFLLK